MRESLLALDMAARTRRPRSASNSTRRPPIKPDAPVTSIRSLRSIALTASHTVLTPSTVIQLIRRSKPAQFGWQIGPGNDANFNQFREIV